MQGLTRTIKSSAEQIVEQSEQMGILGQKSNLFLKVKSKKILIFYLKNKSMANIFQHYINRGLQFYEGDNMQELKQNLNKVAKELLEIASKSREKIINNVMEFLRNDITILIYGNSTVVSDSLVSGAQKGIKFSCIICETRPHGDGYIYNLDYYLKKIQKQVNNLQQTYLKQYSVQNYI
ncbi:initiation factor 2 subunit family protein, putative [Ichthyophthirius multifiliis]|uniref:Initiation factor 2 subunit family protein, putative n=1 Tax=Ichthyophthirius multifiliis TaxID=5932 RepID=G0QMI6_ICHMU|nr:initiation factor 2 subunit family protein, putative [Ichthyophthirius multifiliis]EGR33552.1 initiation factor 2 subunit family protein, putative [Ichthyophthirius multifiliis]|eukprot:XP_004037538.1 initiation factor 2 subunit family protein, putative [Ichthyophthirius multifiliis]